MDNHHINEELERQQRIQMSNPPTSKAWQDASAEIHRLAELLTGKKPRDARSGDAVEITKYEQAALDAVTGGITMGAMLRSLPAATSKDELEKYSAGYDALRRRA